MSKNFKHWTLRCSQKIYTHLLAAYPKAHREKYGEPMRQLFADQSDDAWNDAGNFGLLQLWLRVLPDLIKTSIIEHLAARKENFMQNKINSLTPPRAIFWKVSAVVFFLILSYSVVISFILPDMYASTARVLVEKDI